MRFSDSTQANSAFALLCASSNPAAISSSGRSIGTWYFSTSIVGHRDCLAEEMILCGGDDQRAAGVGGHVEFIDAQSINRERVAMRRIAFIWAWSMISVVAKIGAALHGCSRKNCAVLHSRPLG